MAQRNRAFGGRSMSEFGPTLPTWALQRVGGYPGHTGRDANVVATAALDPMAVRPSGVSRPRASAGASRPTDCRDHPFGVIGLNDRYGRKKAMRFITKN